jgi:HK97 gp10 family phage protein
MQVASTVSLEITGFEDLISALSQLKNTKARAACRAAISQASVPVSRSQKKLAPVDSRQTRKSIGRKIKTYRNSGTTVAIVGPRKGFKAEVTDKKGRKVLRNPTRYAHLVEGGHKIAIGGSLPRTGRKAPSKQGFAGGFVAPRPFVVPALEQNRSKCENIMGRVVREHLRKNGFG